MYKSFEIRNFRCFSDLTLASLERINLIAGVNNVGKTALLEALFLHCGAYKPELTLNLNSFRGIGLMKVELAQLAETPWDALFPNFNASKKVELIGEDQVSGRRVLSLKIIREREDLVKTRQFIQQAPSKPDGSLQSTEHGHILELAYQEGKKHGKHYMIVDSKGVRVEPIPPSPPFPAFFQGARGHIPPLQEAERFGRLETDNKQNVLLEVLRLVEPRLKRLAVVVVAGQPMIHGDINVGRLIPLPVMGEGMVRLTNLVLHLGNAPNGVVLVDEIENGLHYSILPKVWQAVSKVAREFNSQVFATTHSRECIIAAHSSFTESDVYDFCLYRLDRAKGAINVVRHNQETLGTAIEVGMEVR